MPGLRRAKERRARDNNRSKSQRGRSLSLNPQGTSRRGEWPKERTQMKQLALELDQSKGDFTTGIDGERNEVDTDLNVVIDSISTALDEGNDSPSLSAITDVGMNVQKDTTDTDDCTDTGAGVKERGEYGKEAEDDEIDFSFSSFSSNVTVEERNEGEIVKVNASAEAGAGTNTGEGNGEGQVDGSDLERNEGQHKPLNLSGLIEGKHVNMQEATIASISNSSFPLIEGNEGDCSDLNLSILHLPSLDGAETLSEGTGDSDEEMEATAGDGSGSSNNSSDTTVRDESDPTNPNNTVGVDPNSTAVQASTSTLVQGEGNKAARGHSQKCDISPIKPQGMAPSILMAAHGGSNSPPKKRKKKRKPSSSSPPPPPPEEEPQESGGPLPQLPGLEPGEDITSGEEICGDASKLIVGRHIEWELHDFLTTYKKFWNETPSSERAKTGKFKPYGAVVSARRTAAKKRAGIKLGRPLTVREEWFYFCMKKHIFIPFQTDEHMWVENIVYSFDEQRTLEFLLDRQQQQIAVFSGDINDVDEAEIVNNRMRTESGMEADTSVDPSTMVEAELNLSTDSIEVVGEVAKDDPSSQYTKKVGGGILEVKKELAEKVGDTKTVELIKSMEDVNIKKETSSTAKGGNKPPTTPTGAIPKVRRYTSPPQKENTPKRSHSKAELTLTEAELIGNKRRSVPGEEEEGMEEVVEEEQKEEGEVKDMETEAGLASVARPPPLPLNPPPPLPPLPPGSPPQANLGTLSRLLSSTSKVKAGYPIQEPAQETEEERIWNKTHIFFNDESTPFKIYADKHKTAWIERVAWDEHTDSPLLPVAEYWPCEGWVCLIKTGPSDAEHFALRILIPNRDRDPFGISFPQWAFVWEESVPDEEGGNKPHRMVLVKFAGGTSSYELGTANRILESVALPRINWENAEAFIDGRVENQSIRPEQIEIVGRIGPTKKEKLTYLLPASARFHRGMLEGVRSRLFGTESTQINVRQGYSPERSQHAGTPNTRSPQHGASDVRQRKSPGGISKMKESTQREWKRKQSLAEEKHLLSQVAGRGGSRGSRGGRGRGRGRGQEREAPEIRLLPRDSLSREMNPLQPPSTGIQERLESLAHGTSNWGWQQVGRGGKTERGAGRGRGSETPRGRTLPSQHPGRKDVHPTQAPRRDARPSQPPRREPGELRGKWKEGPPKYTGGKKRVTLQTTTTPSKHTGERKGKEAYRSPPIPSFVSSHRELQQQIVGDQIAHSLNRKDAAIMVVENSIREMEKRVERKPLFKDVSGKEGEPPLPPTPAGATERAVYGPLESVPPSEWTDEIHETIRSLNPPSRIRITVAREWNGRFYIEYVPTPLERTRGVKPVYNWCGADGTNVPFNSWSVKEVLKYWKTHSRNSDALNFFKNHWCAGYEKSFESWFGTWRNSPWHSMPMPKEDPKSMSANERSFLMIRMEVWQMSAVKPRREPWTGSAEPTWRGVMWEKFSRSWFDVYKYYKNLATLEQARQRLQKSMEERDQAYTAPPPEVIDIIDVDFSPSDDRKRHDAGLRGNMPQKVNEDSRRSRRDSGREIDLKDPNIIRKIQLADRDEEGGGTSSIMSPTPAVLPPPTDRSHEGEYILNFYGNVEGEEHAVLPHETWMVIYHFMRKTLRTLQRDGEDKNQWKILSHGYNNSKGCGWMLCAGPASYCWWRANIGKIAPTQAGHFKLESEEEGDTVLLSVWFPSDREADSIEELIEEIVSNNGTRFNDLHPQNPHTRIQGDKLILDFNVGRREAEELLRGGEDVELDMEWGAITIAGTPRPVFVDEALGARNKRLAAHKRSHSQLSFDRVDYKKVLDDPREDEAPLVKKTRLALDKMKEGWKNLPQPDYGKVARDLAQGQQKFQEMVSRKEKQRRDDGEVTPAKKPEETHPKVHPDLIDLEDDCQVIPQVTDPELEEIKIKYNLERSGEVEGDIADKSTTDLLSDVMKLTHDGASKRARAITAPDLEKALEEVGKTGNESPPGTRPGEEDKVKDPLMSPALVDEKGEPIPSTSKLTGSTSDLMKELTQGQVEKLTELEAAEMAQALQNSINDIVQKRKDRGESSSDDDGDIADQQEEPEDKNKTDGSKGADTAPDSDK
jgi:hypothetical protein